MYVTKINDFKNQAHVWIMQGQIIYISFFFTKLTELSICFVCVWTELEFLLMKLYFMLPPWYSCSSVIWNNVMRYWLFGQHALKLLLKLWMAGLLRRERKRGEFLMNTVGDFLSTWWFELDALNQRNELFNCRGQIQAKFAYLEFRIGRKSHISQEMQKLKTILEMNCCGPLFFKSVFSYLNWKK